MAWYVGAVDGPRRTLVVGPFRRAGDALAHVEPVRRWAVTATRDGAFAGFGLVHDRGRHRPVPARFLQAYGRVRVGPDGWAEEVRPSA